MSGGILKLVKVQPRNALPPMLLMSLWGRIGHQSELSSASLWILLSEAGMLILIMERSHQSKELNPISTRPSRAHLGQLRTIGKRYGWIDPDTDNILRSIAWHATIGGCCIYPSRSP